MELLDVIRVAAADTGEGEVSGSQRGCWVGFQGPDNTPIEPVDGVGGCRGDIECRERLGGMLRYYYRAAA